MREHGMNLGCRSQVLVLRNASRLPWMMREPRNPRGTLRKVLQCCQTLSSSNTTTGKTGDASERAIVGDKQGPPLLEACCRVQRVRDPEIQVGTYFGGIFPQCP